MNVLHVFGTDQSGIAASSTFYFPAMFGPDYSATELGAQTKFASAGTVSLMGCYVSVNDRGDSTLRVDIGASDGNSLVTLTAGGSPGQFEDGSNSDAFVDDGLITKKVITGAGGTACVISDIWHTFAPSSGTVTILSGALSATFSGTADAFFPLMRPSSITTTEANAQNTFTVAATLDRAQTYIQTNSRSDTVDFRTRKNATSNGNLTTQYATTVTGVVEDLSNSDTVADGDEWCWLWDQNAGSGSMSNQKVVKVECTATTAFPLLAANHGGTTQAAATTHYHPVAGGMHFAETTEADSQVKSNEVVTWSDLTGNVTANSLNTGAITITARVNSVNGNQTVAWTTPTASIQTDASNTDAVVDNDELAVSSVTGGASGTATLRAVSSVGTGAAPPGGGPPAGSLNLLGVGR